MTTKKTITYRDAGVDIDAGNALVHRIKDYAKKTRRPEVMAGLGGFGALCEIPSHYKQPVLVSGTDGVGTKLKLAQQLGKHDSIGIDLVAMCVNDLVVAGAEPLFFLDYFATGSLDVDVAADVIKGIAEGCEKAGAALVGGETAEMPGMYQGEDYDLAGFCVGVVEKSEIIDGSAIQLSDTLIALKSSGVHSNGYSLVRKVLETNGIDASTTTVGDMSLADALMLPTRIYVKPLLRLMKTLEVHTVAHITGGGITENLPRVLPTGVGATIDLSSWEMPPVFQWLQENAGLDNDEMLKTFNCGAGMIVAVPQSDAEDAIQMLNSLGEEAWVIGKLNSIKADEPAISYT